MQIDARMVWAALVMAWLLYVNRDALQWLGAVAVALGVVFAVWAVTGAFVHHLFRPPD